ncbi:MAG: GrpB family protein [Cyanobacteria bacterium P01_D01_bin.56]
MSQDPIQPVNPLREAEIVAATIGTPELLNSTVYLAEYDPIWPQIFSQLADDIHAVLGENVCLLEHVGSTSVPGLAAKPIIDMLLAVTDSSKEATYVPQLETLGYTLKAREPDWFEHRVLKLPDPKVNLHVFSAGCEEIQRMIAFRDWLRNHSEDKQQYETTKRQLAQQTWKRIQHYADAKSEVVQEIMSRAYPKLREGR